MIIKCLSRKGNVDQLIKYVLADHKIEPVREKPYKQPYIPGIKLSEKDRYYLEVERNDSALMKEFKEHAKDGNMVKFIQEHILKQDKKEVVQKLPGILIKQNIRARSIAGYVKAFTENEKMRQHVRNNNVKAYHHIISFSNLDTKQINEGILKDIAQKYMSLRGDNSLFLGAVHQDKEHIHIHLVQSGTQYCTGLANRVSKQQFQEQKLAMQAYQKEKYPQLVHSLPEHGRSKDMQINRAVEKNIKTHERSVDKDILLGLLETIYSKSTSTEHFLSQLQTHGHEPYFRNGRLQGVKFDGEHKFRFSNLGFKERINDLEMLKEREGKELKEIQQLRGGRSNRLAELNKQEQASKQSTYEDVTKGMDDNEKRNYQQKMLNRSSEFEKGKGIDTTLSTSLANDSSKGNGSTFKSDTGLSQSPDKDLDAHDNRDTKEDSDIEEGRENDLDDENDTKPDIDLDRDDDEIDR